MQVRRYTIDKVKQLDILWMIEISNILWIFRQYSSQILIDLWHSIANNYRFKHSFCIISSMSMLSEIVFVNGKLNAIRYQENYVASYCLSWLKSKTKKQFFNKTMAPIHSAAAIKKWFQDFVIGLLPDREPKCEILARVYDGEKPPIENIVETWKKHKSRMSGYSKRNLK